MSIWSEDDPTGTKASEAPEDYDEGPYVCPGCYAVAAPCLPGCIDAEIEADRERDRETREMYGDDDEDDLGVGPNDGFFGAPYEDRGTVTDIEAADDADRARDEDASSDRDARILPAALTDDWDIIF